MNGSGNGTLRYALECTRVYTRRGGKAHLMSPLQSPNLRGNVLCPVLPEWPDEWLGTGSQNETDRAASLPLCRTCHLLAAAQDGYRAQARERAS